MRDAYGWKDRLFGPRSSLLSFATKANTNTHNSMTASTSLAPLQSISPVSHANTTTSRQKLLGATADILATAIVLGMMLRTLAYVYRRKRGQTGPATLRPLLHFWVCHAFVEIGARFLSIWLAPIRLSWPGSVLRATLLTILAFSSHRIVKFVYDFIARELLAPLEPNVDEFLRAVRELIAKNREWGVAAADELVSRYSVGGIASVAAAFRGENVQRQPTTIAPEQAPGVEEKVRRSVVVCAKPEEPKAAYSDSRKLRESFRKRAAAVRKQAESR